jgi:hypothetical protein
MPISTFPRHDDYDEDEYLLKTRPLRDTRSEGKVIARLLSVWDQPKFLD